MAATTTIQMKLIMAKPAHKAAVKHAMKKDRARKIRKPIKAAPIRLDKHNKLPEAETKTGELGTTIPHQKVASQQVQMISGG